MDKKIVKSTIQIAMSNLLIVISGIITGLALPKILGVTEYGLYKTFNLYTTYVVFLDLGISNGIYLQYGGYTRETVPSRIFRLYFKILLALQIFFSITICLISFIFLHSEYKFIFAMLSLYTIANNIATYYEKISIMTGEFSASIKRNILRSVLSIIIVAILWLCVICNISVRPYKIYTVLFVLIYILLAVQYVEHYKELSFGKTDKLSNHTNELRNIIITGLVLLLADTIANLILNMDRQFVSAFFSIEEYSLYAFAYSMLKIVILAVSAISTVLYPTLKRMTHEEMKESYRNSISLVSIIAFASLMVYYPLCLIVKEFLPEYIGSLQIFRVLFPGISINSIISIVMINHYKALGKQMVYFWISLCVLVIAILTNIIAYNISGSPIGFAVASVVTIIIWYAVSDINIRQKYKIRSWKQYVYIFANCIFYYMISDLSINYYLKFFLNILIFIGLSIIFFKREVIRLLYQIYKMIKR